MYTLAGTIDTNYCYNFLMRLRIKIVYDIYSILSYVYDVV